MALYWINATYFCAGVITDDSGSVIEAAPILRWAKRKKVGNVLEQLNKNRIILEYVIT